MNVTGIVRYMDDLGRVVIPKEIRKVVNIYEGDSLEIFTTKEGGVYLKKYIPNDETIPEEPETTLKDEPITKEKVREMINITSCNGDTKLFNLTEEQFNLVSALYDLGFIYNYETFSSNDIITP